MKKIEEYTPYELATLATALGVIIAKQLNTNQQNVVGNFIEAVGQSILTIAAQIQNLQSQSQSQSQNQSGNTGNSNSNGSINDLQKQIDELTKYIKK